MTQFNLFDRVRLLEPIALTDYISNVLEAPEFASEGTVGDIVEVLEPGKVFLVELFGDWIVMDSDGYLHRAKREDENAFRETLGVETVHNQQIALVDRSNVMKVNLFQMLNEMPEDLLQEVQTFAESLKDKVL